MTPDEQTPNERIGTLAAEVMDWRDEHHPDADLTDLVIVVGVEDDEGTLYIHSLCETPNKAQHVGLLRLALASLETPASVDED